MEANLEKDVSAEKAEEAVKDLYRFCTHFFQNVGVEHAASKWKEVKVQMEASVKLLESLQDSLPKELYWSLKGRALNILPDHCQEAEDYLSRAIKQDPSNVDTWNALGESYWKAGKVQLAHDCFAGSLAHSVNKESLRNLSMVLRQMGKDAKEKEAKAKESLEKAKEAVALDVKDGTSWMILGNAYLALFFMTGQDVKMLKQCYAAYSHAEKDPVVAMNPDLHFNRATLSHYDEEYQKMLEELDKASLLDPDWAAPKDKLKSSWDFLTAMANLVSSKGKIKTKTLSAIMEALSAPQTYISDSGLNSDAACGKEGKKGMANGSKRVLTRLSDLKEGSNSGAVVVVGVAAIVPSKETLPHGCVVLDVEESCVGLTVYNLANAVEFPPGKILTISDPHLNSCSIRHKGQEVSFKNIRVSDPSKLLVNGEALKNDKLVPSAVVVTAFS